jgi:hypothetical protein
MSGPIVRKYGFPNFEKIFGERPLEHGVDENEAPDRPAEKSADAGESASPEDAAKPTSEKPRNKK